MRNNSSTQFHMVIVTITWETYMWRAWNNIQHVANKHVSSWILLTSVLICFPIFFLLKFNILKIIPGKREEGRKEERDSIFLPLLPAVCEEKRSSSSSRGNASAVAGGWQRTGAWLYGHRRHHQEEDASSGTEALNRGTRNRLAWKEKR